MKNAHIIYWQEGKFWIAKCIENSVASQGLTYEEAKENIKEALLLTFEDEENENEYSIHFPSVSHVKTEVLSFA